MLKLKSLLMESAPKLNYTVGKLKIDAVNGLGAVPDNSNITYLGFVAWMLPSEFLKLNPARPGGLNPEIVKQLDSGTGSIAPPFLIVEWKNGYWQVKQHEGRARCKFIMQRYGDFAIPVQIFPRNQRARNMTEEMLKAPFKGDGTSAIIYASKIEHSPSGR